MEDGSEHRLRLFFALWPGAAGRAALVRWQASLHALCDGRIMRPQTLHCTLAFLGEVEAQRLEALELAAAEVVFRPFRLELARAGYWGHNHIVYAAPATTPPPLAALVQDLEASLCRHRFRFDRRPYTPHVTLLRNTRWSDAPLPPMPVARWQMRRFALVQSLNGSYRVLAHFGVPELE